MERYRIAGLNVDMNLYYERTISQAEKYKVEEDGTQADMTIDIPLEKIVAKAAEGPVEPELQEYMSTGAAFYRGLLRFNGLMLHASAVELDGKAYLFSAPSGTGKSTHTSRWVSYFGSERAAIINDDKPAIREIDGEFYVMGTPWSGKTNLNENKAVPPAAIAFIERGETNRIERMSAKEAIKNLMWQTVRPSKEQNMDRLLISLDKLLKTVPVYKLYCNISDEAVEVAYQAMKEGI